MGKKKKHCNKLIVSRNQVASNKVLLEICQLYSEEKLFHFFQYRVVYSIRISF